MLCRTHLLLGIVFFLLFHNFFYGGNVILFFGLVLLGSILPDIDERHSTVNRWSGFIGRIISFFFHHRGIFHSLLFAAVIFWAMKTYAGLYYAIGLALGYVAHLAGDALTPMGVQVFYPFSSFRLRGPMKTGGLLEWVIFILLAVLIVKEVV